MDTQTERDRIKEILNRKFNRLIELREEEISKIKLKNRKKRRVVLNTIALCRVKELQENIIFLIDNPDYKSIKKPTS